MGAGLVIEAWPLWSAYAGSCSFREDAVLAEGGRTKCPNIQHEIAQLSHLKLQSLGEIVLEIE